MERGGLAKGAEENIALYLKDCHIPHTPRMIDMTIGGRNHCLDSRGYSELLDIAST